MNLNQIETKCFILALFIRDDGERFLLGSRAYEFVDSQLHFVANSYQNDIVEVQGNDGVMLAGQVRRGTSQPFDGYIGDQTVDRSTIEQYRRDFMKFFRKNHYYKVVYVFPDGSAVQRRNGFIVEAPEVKELYQLFPQYHISMNFEDINYYVYEEDSDGEEIYGESAILKIATSATGGLIWEEGTESEITGEGSQFTLQDTIDGNVLNSVQLKGDTTQQTYSGKNLFSPSVHFTSKDNVDVTNTSSTIDVSGGGYATYTIPTEFSTNDSVTLSGIATPKVQNQYRILYRYSDDGSSWTGYLTLASGSPGVNVSANFSGTVTGHKYYRLLFYAKGYAETGTGEVKYEQIQFEKGTATTFEPYVGGIASPNPDYPQEVNTVTGRQVVGIYGKNLWDSEIVIGGIGSAGSPLNRNDRFNSATKIKVLPNTTYTFSAISKTTGKTLNVVFQEYDSNGTIIGQNPGNYFSVPPLTITTSANCEYVTLSGRYSDDTVFGTVGDSTDAIQNIQFELGSSATPYESRQSYDVNLGKNLLDPSILIQGDITGGTSTDRVCTRSGDDIYVSGGETYTISVSDIAIQVNVYGYKSINSTAIYESGWQSMPFTFELPSQANYLRLMFRYSNDSDIVPSDITCQLEKGSATTYAPYFTPIELCKIGNYQDYIYKSGDDWYVHKETGKAVLDGSGTWYRQTTSGGVNYRFSVAVSDVKQAVTGVVGYSDKLIPVTTDTYVQDGISGTSSAQRISIRYDSIFGQMTTEEVQAWLADNPITAYYVLNTPTNTQITNPDLMAQLEALLGATTYDGQTAFTVSSENQLAILDVTVIARTGGGVVWDNYGAEWEEGTGGGPTMVNIDSIDNVYPVWTVTGPAVNPQISVLTTNTTLSYSGTVTSSQELKIDMFNKTATLNGASVVGNVSGDWVYLKPGVNRITYTTNNADAPDSTIWWQEIVG